MDFKGLNPFAGILATLIVEFPQEADVLHEKLLTFSDTSICVHCGQSLKEYIERHDWRACIMRRRDGRSGTRNGVSQLE